jgi:hypothetical protein
MKSGQNVGTQARSTKQEEEEGARARRSKSKEGGTRKR